MAGVRKTVLVGAAALGLAVGLPGAVQAATAPPQPLPAYQGAPGAKKIEGKASSADAPLVAAGQAYTDTVAPGERVYRLNLDDASSVYFSAVLQPPRGAKVGYGDGLEVALMTKEGARCPDNPGKAGFGYDPVPLGAVAVRRLEEDAECQGAGVYFAKITRTAAKDSDQSAWPVELLLRREPGLAAGSAPTTAPSVWPSASPTLPGIEPVARSGGTGFNDARALDSGVWRDDLRPGQTRFYRVPLDWGQQLGLSAELADARMTKSYGSASNGLTVALYSPYRSLVADKDISYSGKQAGVTLPKTAPVAYENRFSGTDEVAGARVAGWYYIAVTLGGKVAEFTEDASPVPLTLRMDVIGSPAKGPAYKESLTAAGFGVGADERAAAKDGLTAPEASAAAGDRSVMRVVAGAGFGTGTALLLVLGGWILLARRGRGA
ncbi:hypothetical protein [Streptomyces sp. KS 21]|uniref:hypothetical protein n=1 Tax=Streptomyces sp. KS 21 TaxID=2485150 RepID=UPI0010E93E0B|nr:hypothetical protein [Streptomyces sp. KS 21]TDU77170.1 hypothetical protein EDD91_3902 [Streptomyces sp. KS 21]